MSTPHSNSVASSPHTRPLGPWTAIAAWLATAVVVAVSGVITYERRFLIPACLITATAALVLAHRKVASFRALVSGLDVRLLVGLHALRAPIGASFLLLEGLGLLTPAFARPAGLGDIAVGLAALAIAPFAAKDAARPAVRILSLLGLIDILSVIVLAQRALLFGAPNALAGLLRFPFPLLPTFYVPIVIATHLALLKKKPAPPAR